MVEKKCYICGLSRHFFKDCPQKKWETQTFAGFEYEISTTTETKHEQEQSRNRTEFFPGSIHAEEVRGFWREELKAGELAWMFCRMDTSLLLLRSLRFTRSKTTHRLLRI
jgi:hypothetical protein